MRCARAFSLFYLITLRAFAMTKMRILHVLLTLLPLLARGYTSSAWVDADGLAHSLERSAVGLLYG